ncbi:MAG: hypothetical protein DRP94_03860 [Candidatus Latescibacterota bacterium]|nr:MAG: hypothetical protein DRP94_03860 [Candidatus Latescibacterota bacterium]RKY74735.1 MAG: hypothetical protein DRQ14_01020 [Candidatus Latescibacterota bacterium]HDI00452.1 amino acid ABC transporter substrate-binding protein [Bacillota bacterium]
MRRVSSLLSWLLVLVSATLSWGIPDSLRYANTPDDMVPYRRIKPYKRYFLVPLEYTGPGREYPEPDPSTLKSVKIGYIGPLYRVLDPGISVTPQYFEIGQNMLRGAQMAIDEANARGGWRGILPYELVLKNDTAEQVDDTWMWGPVGSNVVDLIWKDKVWALFTTISSENSHILIRIALKAEIPIMGTADTDPTFVETKIPWLFRCISDDRLQCYILAKYAYEKLGLKHVAIIRVNDRYGRVGVKEFREASRRLGHPVLFEVRYPRMSTDFTAQLARLEAARKIVDGVLAWGNDYETAHLVREIRKRGFDVAILCSDRVITDRFLKIAGPAAEGVIASCPWNPESKDPVYLAFKERYQKRYGVPPETYAAHAYDGMNMLIEAIEKAGLNKAKIRDALDEYRIHPYHGVTGTIILNDVYTDVGPVSIAIVKGGKFHFYSEEELGIRLCRYVKK